jgi:hypothetical protein
MKTYVTTIDNADPFDPFIVQSPCRRVVATPHSSIDDYQVKAPTLNDIAGTKPGGKETTFTPPAGKDWYAPGDIAGYGKSLGGGSIDFTIEEHVR